jgi:hypothetical protein
MRKNLFLLPFLLLSLSGYSQQLEWIPFKWVEDDQIGNKSAIIIPVTIDDLPDKFDMQFDLGADVSIFRGNTIDPYLKKNESLREKLDTTNVWMHGRDVLWLNNIHLKLGKVSFNGVNVLYYKNYGQVPKKKFTHKSQTVLIGTIGTNLFQDKALVIDYKNTRLAVADSLPVEYENLPYERIELDVANRALIPFRINDKEEWLLFDTGSSSSQLHTSKKRALAISDSIAVDSVKAYSWGDLITVVDFKVNKPVEFAGKVLENPIVSYVTDERRDERSDRDYKDFNIWGLTGNAFFWNNVVIIDYKNKTFRVK